MDAQKYASSAAFFAIVTCQIFTIISIKTRYQSVLFHGFQNEYTLWGIWQELAVMISLAYFLPLNYAFGTRDLQLIHHSMPALPFGLLIIVYDEIRKYLVRTLPDREEGRHSFVK